MMFARMNSFTSVNPRPSNAPVFHDSTVPARESNATSSEETKRKMSIESLLQPTSTVGPSHHMSDHEHTAASTLLELASGQASPAHSLYTQSSSSITVEIESQQSSIDMGVDSTTMEAPPVKTKHPRAKSLYNPKALCNTEMAATYNTPPYRFAKNISCWLGGLDVKSKAGSEWYWAELESMAGDLMPSKNVYLSIPDIFDAEVVLLDHAVKAPANTAQKNVWREGAVVGLHQTEQKVCQYLGLPFDKYRVIRAALIIGFACIYEQNRRGTSMSVCSSHPAMKNNKFTCINVGPSQAQLIVPGVDANIASRIFKVFQAWKWFPHSFLETKKNGSGRLTKAVERQFGEESRAHLLREYRSWERVEELPSDLSMVIRDTEYTRLPKIFESSCRFSGCSCEGKRAIFQPPLGVSSRKRKASQSNITQSAHIDSHRRVRQHRV